MLHSRPYHGKSHGSRWGSLLLRTIFFLALALFAVGLWAQARQPLKVAPSALQQMQVLKDIKAAKSPTQNKIDSRLYLGVQALTNPALRGSLPDFRFMTNESDGRVPVQILLVQGAGAKPIVEKLASLGEILRSRTLRFPVLSARVRLENLEAIAAMPEVLKVRQAIPFLKQVINTSEGDVTHGADEARSFFGNIGTGIKVGVISDGVDSLASLQASGDLPPTVQVLPGQAGSGDEGSAMLEIVHDLAPGADLAFATAIIDEAQFAQNILDLATAGCDIIVDDIIYLDESPFQDGPVAQAVNTVTAAGVLYFSSAGNEGNANDLTSGTWEGDFLASAAADPGPLAGANLHDFGDGGNSILVEFGGGNPPLLIWAEHYDLATGNASTDFDIYDMDGALTTIFDASTDVQDGAGGDDFPIEFIGGGTFGGERLLIDKFAAGVTSSVPMLNLIVFRGELDDTLATSGATRGHSGASDAFSVAATPADASFDGISADGPFPGLFTAANESENFTSDGPRRVILSDVGVEITPGNRTSTGGVVRQKPDITAADGVATAAPGFNPFYGTSAAAPHAAAIAALLQSAVPAITPAQVRTALVTSAIDIEIAGTDRDTGAGIIMAHAALLAAGAVPGAFLSAGAAVPTQAVGDGDAFVENNEIWNLTIPLTNDGGAGATAISGTLSTVTPGVTINTSVSAYPDLAIAASGNNVTPFSFTVTPAVPCGATIEFTLTVTYTGGNSPQSFDFTIKTGSPGVPVTISYTGVIVPIPDGADLSGTLPGAPVTASLLVSGITGNIFDIDFRIDGTACSATAGSTTVGIDHTFVNDLDITLISPATTSALLINNTDGGGNNFCQTLLNDDGGDPNIQGVASASAPFTGSFTPNSALSAFDGEVANGTWQLQAQDFFSQDTGNIRTFSLIITPAVCDAPPLAPIVSGTKTASAGPYFIGGTVTYTVVLTNTGFAIAPDNATNEFTDILPAGLTLVSANATSGTALATIGTNTVTWNGSIAPAASVTITISATINAGASGSTVTNQGTIAYDADLNGSNETSVVTDDPGTGTASDGTAIVVAGAAIDTLTKTVSGTYTPGSVVTYTIIITNTGDAVQADNPGDELTDVLPAELTLTGASASSGTAVATIGTNTVTWNGSIAVSGTVTITITAIVEPGNEGVTISNQATHLYDADGNGTNETTALSDDPGTGAANDPTSFVAAAGLAGIPTTSELGLLLLAVGLAMMAAWKISHI